ncbi:MAG: hypothetical protein NTX97_02450 [Bacteroidetes bacterium]|nr:hypothetical protein [Bacteroidota bacterium]
MNSHKKRILLYCLCIGFGFSGAYLFLRKKNNPIENITTESASKKDSLVTTSLLKESYDLENNTEAFITTDKSFTGKKSCKLTSSIEYGVSINKTIKDIPSFKTLKSISITYNCFPGKENADALYVLSIEDGSGKNLFWGSQPIVFNNKSDWSQATADFIIAPELLNPDYKIVAYPWNRNKKEFYIDDIHIDYVGTSVFQNAPAAQSEKSNLFFDFETEAGLSNNDNVKETTAHSGKKACDLSGGKEYGPVINKKISELGTSIPKKISMSVWVFPLTDNPNTLLTASITNTKNENVFWEGKSTENRSFPKNKWTKINASCFLPVEKISPDDVLGVGVWNKGKSDIIIDDLEIVYGESPERRGSPSTVDATAIYEKRFIGEKNKPPFKTIYFEKQEINNGNTTSITPSDKKNIVDNFSPNDEYLVGDLVPDKNNLEEIICIKDGSQGLFAYSSENKIFTKLWENTNTLDSLWNNNNTAYCGDFNNDGKTDVLLVNKKNNDWKIIDFVSKKWGVVSQGNKPKTEWITKKTTVKSGIINSADAIYPGQYADNTLTFLKFNTDWRFDMKLLEQNDKDYTILGNVDFKGYPDDHNPKYYEFVKIIPGKFLSTTKTSLIVVMSNCVDTEFDGKHCKQIDNMPQLPNSTQVYNMSK